jgi:hypothetical protein
MNRGAIRQDRGGRLRRQIDLLLRDRCTRSKQENSCDQYRLKTSFQRVESHRSSPVH